MVKSSEPLWRLPTHILVLFYKLRSFFAFSFRSSWPGQQGDLNLPRARRTLMKTTKAGPPLFLEPWTCQCGFANHFLLVYLKLNRLIYFVVTANLWLSNYVEAEFMDGSVCFLRSWSQIKGTCCHVSVFSAIFLSYKQNLIIFFIYATNAFIYINASVSNNAYNSFFFFLIDSLQSKCISI